MLIRIIDIINFLVPAVRWSVPLGVISLVFCLIKRYPWKKTVYWTLFIAYIGAVIGGTIMSGAVYDEHLYQLVPFKTVWMSVLKGQYYPVILLLFSMLLFIPLGVFLRIGKELFFTSLVLSVVFSIVIELVEYITKTGVFDINDVIMNEIGTIIGITITGFLFKCFGRDLYKTQDKNE